MKTDGLGLSSLLFHPGRPRTYGTSPKPKRTPDPSPLPDKVSVSSQEELDEVLKDDRVSSGEIPILLPETGSFAITSGTPLLHVTTGDPWIRVAKDSAPTIIASGISQPYMEARDSSAPIMEAHGTDKPVMAAYDSSEPIMAAYHSSEPIMEARGSSAPNMKAYDSSKPDMKAYGTSKPVMGAYGNSSPTVSWKSTAPNSGLIDMR